MALQEPWHLGQRKKLKKKKIKFFGTLLIVCLLAYYIVISIFLKCVWNMSSGIIGAAEREIYYIAVILCLQDFDFPFMMFQCESCYRLFFIIDEIFIILYH